MLSPDSNSSIQVIMLGGSWVVISGVRSRVPIVRTRLRGFVTLRITTHEPPSATAGLDKGSVRVQKGSERLLGGAWICFIRLFILLLCRGFNL